MTHKPRKRFGQNFLQDPVYQQKIASSIRLNPGSQVLEIGPGKGALTQHLIKRVEHLHVIEMDRDLVTLLSQQYPPEKLTIYQGDVLNFDFSQLASRWSVIGNLPYNISTPLIFRLLEFIDHIDDMVFMLQKEVVDRLIAGPGSKTYGRLSVMAGLDLKCERLFNVPPGAFYPAPKVTSSVVRLTPLKQRLALEIRPQIARIVSAAFAQRRKTLRNGLKKLVDAVGFEAAGVDPSERAEQLSIEEFISLAGAIKELP